MTVYAVDVPLRNQDTERQNAPDDCVPDSLAAMLAAVTGMQLTGTAVLDLAYPAGYTGFTNPAHFVDALKARGMLISYFNSPFGASGNVAAAIENLKIGRPILVAIPSDWNASPPVSQFNHVLVLKAWDSVADTVTLMNPFHGVYMTQARAWLVDRMGRCQYQGIWSGEKVSATVATVDTSGLGTGFAAFAQAHGLTCVSRDAAGVAEHAYASNNNMAQTFASFAPTAEFPTGVILFYDAGTGEITAGKAPWVAMALWNRSEAMRQNALAVAAHAADLQHQLDAANAEIAALQAAQPDPNAKRLQAMGAAFDALVKLADQSVAA